MTAGKRVNPYANFLEKLEKPARYIGGEKYQVQKNWDQCFGKVALCFPDTYEIGMSHLGLKILYQEINSKKGLLAERCFSPWTDMEKEMRRRDLELVTLENFRPIKDFDLVGFSLQYEMSYTNILTMLDLGNIPIFQKERTEKDPFVIVGGPCATHPEPLSPFVDIVLVGDGEELFSLVTSYVGKARREKQSRDSILKELSGWVGLYVPSHFKESECKESGLGHIVDESSNPAKAKRFLVEDLQNYPFPIESPVPHMTAIFDRFSVELARGCTEGCRFCQAGMIYRPVRERKPDNVIESVMKGMEKGGYSEASLTCLSTADYSAVTPLILNLIDRMKVKKAKLGISSLRAYGLDERIFDKLSEVQNTSLTFAPEAGSQRMRKVINKNISEEDLLKTAHNVFSRGMNKMKLYFMIGLPTETDEDVIEIMETARKARDIAKQYGVNPVVTVSVSSFVPKPHTPFQWAAMDSLEEIERKQNLLSSLAKKYRLNFRKHVSKTSILEGVVARGDRKVADLIYLAWTKGARFDGYQEHFDFDLWISCINELGLDISNYLGTIPLDATLPWDHIDVGLKERFLKNEWKRAVKSYLSPPCGKVNKEIVHFSNLEDLNRAHEEEKKKLVCYHCGIKCDLSGMVQERKDYLKILGAEKSTPYIRPEALKSASKKKKQSASANDTSPKYWYRFKYSKVGPLAFISHLDLQKVLIRIFKRAGFDLAYSNGFRPRAMFSFAPALGLGVCSLSEYVDVALKHEIKIDDGVLSELNNSAESGLEFFELRERNKSEKSLNQTIKSYSYFLPSKEKLDTGTLDFSFKDFDFKKKVFKENDLNGKVLSSKHEKIKWPSDGSSAKLISEVYENFDSEGLLVKVSCDEGSSVRPMDLWKSLKKYNSKIGRPVRLETHF